MRSRLSTASVKDKTSLNPSPTVSDAIIGLRAARNFVKDIDRDHPTSQALDDLVRVLQPYSRLTLRDIESILRLTSKERVSIISDRRRKELETITLEQLRDESLRNLLSNEELALVAQHVLGMARSSLIKIGRKGMEAAIDNALENIQTLNTIAENASRSE